MQLLTSQKFQKILALSKSPSWRSRGLIAAANQTSLDIEIPKQPFIAPEMIEAFSKIGGKEVNGHPKTGSAHAWLAHLDLLRYGVSSNLDTFLIIEDDVDWDIHVKDQMALISDNVREFRDVEEEDESPYGRSWDLLWLGHCGEHTDPSTKRVEFEDPTVPSVEQYVGWSKKWLPHLQAGNRAIQEGINPVCTFGYAVTSHGAQRLLDFAGKGGNEAYDIRLLDGCKNGHLNCVTVQPEIMHHYEPPAELGYKSLVKQEDGKGDSEDEEKFEAVMGRTENILESARCQALFDSTCIEQTP
jgi:hypothetical protein